jgi:AcrR family transcriptional regulator
MARQSSKRSPQQPTFIEEARRRPIIDAARKVFLATGFEKSTIMQIAEAIDVSKGVILYHFGSKSDLGKAVLEETLASYGDHITQELSKIDDALEKVLAFPSICAAFFESRQDEFILYMDALGSFGEVSDKRAYMASANTVQRSYLIRLINNAKREGTFKGVSSKPLADAMQAFVDGINSQYCADPSQVRPSASAEVFRQMLGRLA